MTENSPDKDETEVTYVSKFYNCPKCQKTHSVRLPANLAENRRRYPFPYVFMHSTEGKANDLVTLLYIDAEMQIRGAEVVELEKSNIISENLAKEIVERLTDKIMDLEEENFQLKGLIQNLDIQGEEESASEEAEEEPVEELELDEDILLEGEEESGTEEKEEDLELDEEDYIDFDEELVLAEDEEEQGEEEAEEKEKDVAEKDLTPIPPDLPKEVKKTEEIYSKTPQMTQTPQPQKISLFFLSTIGPGEKKQKLTVKSTSLISELKETVGNLYGLDPSNFHLSYAGLTMDEENPIGDYNLEDNEEILIIPSSTAG
ncbi:MAG: hypothetical protein EU544_02235 [Promethearchaeota archaeon]|nr:MAG: hypothetical protein EU544_02235 [Candidatus Lokiarchaeota archaeon]